MYELCNKTLFFLYTFSISLSRLVLLLVRNSTSCCIIFPLMKSIIIITIMIQKMHVKFCNHSPTIRTNGCPWMLLKMVEGDYELMINWLMRQWGTYKRQRSSTDLSVGYISCDFVKINNNTKKSVIINKQQKLTVNIIWIEQV